MQRLLSLVSQLINPEPTPPAQPTPWDLLQAELGWSWLATCSPGFHPARPSWTENAVGDVLADVLEEGCSRFGLSPLASVAGLVLALLTLLFAALSLLKRVIRWWTAQHGRAFVSVASSALQELRRAKPELYPPTAHAFSNDPQTDTAPAVCAVCFAPVADQGDGQSCELCHIVVHHSCARYAPHDCKALVLPNVSHPVHDWRPAGVTLPSAAAQDSATSGLQEGGDTDSNVEDASLPQLCLYCQEPCEVGLFAVEPVWSCSWCHCLAHVQCFVARHPTLFTDATKAMLQCQVKGLLDNEDSLEGPFSIGSSPRARSLSATPFSTTHHPTPAPTPGTHRNSSSSAAPPSRPCEGTHTINEEGTPAPTPPDSGDLVTSDGGGGGGRRSRSGSGGLGAHFGAAGRAPSARASEDRSGSNALATGAGFSWGAGGEGGGSGKGGYGSGEAMQGGGTGAGGVLGSTAELDQCKLGPVGCAVLPPTALREVGRGIAHSGSAKSRNGSNHSRRKRGSHSGRTGKGTGGGSSAVVARGAQALAQTTARHWWQRQEPKWTRFVIEPSALAPGTRPLLVFVNSKSGPQLGFSLRTQLLQLLNPLQVVTLPREKPEPALRFFAHVPGLRVLVMGGDGTVGWVLKAIMEDLVPAVQAQAQAEVQALAAAQEAAAAEAAAAAAAAADAAAAARAAASAAADASRGGIPIAGAAGEAGNGNASPATAARAAAAALGAQEGRAKAVNGKMHVQGGAGPKVAVTPFLSPFAAPISAPSTPIGGDKHLMMRHSVDGRIKSTNNLHHASHDFASTSAKDDIGLRGTSALMGTRSQPVSDADVWGARTWALASRHAGWRPPAVAILPMGTGNDLARCLGWGGGLTAHQKHSLVSAILEVHTASPVYMDRWDLALSPLPPPRSRGTAASSLKRLMRGRQPSPSGQPSLPAQDGSGTTTSPGGTKHGKGSQLGALHQAQLLPLPTLAPQSTIHKTLNNYLGIGIDAKVALEFHSIREAYPSWFQSQFGNKVWYTGIGAPDLIRRSCADISQKLQLICDGVEVPVPPDAEGLIITNINCHMGGVYLWETGLPAQPIPLPPNPSPAVRSTAAALTKQRRQTISDGLIEVVAIGGVVHMGRLAVGLARAQRLCQCKSIAITTKAKLPMQVDGEPFLQDPSHIVVTHKDQATMLRRVGGSPALKVASVVSEVLESAYERGIISARQRSELGKEMLSRLEPLG